MLLTHNIADPNDPATWSFQSYVDVWDGKGIPAETNAERLAHVKQLGSMYCEPFRSAALWLKDDTYVPKDVMKHWEHPVAWDNHGGRITLAGDAVSNLNL